MSLPVFQITSVQCTVEPAVASVTVSGSFEPLTLLEVLPLATTLMARSTSKMTSLVRQSLPPSPIWQV